MADFTAKDVQDLRKLTGAGMMDAKKALEATGGDKEKAAEYLREQGIAAAAKRADRTQTEGVVGVYMHHQAGRPVLGVLVGLASETDFVAKSDEFKEAANDIAMHAAASRPQWINREDIPEDVLAEEKRIIAAQARNEGKPDEIVDKIVAGRIESFFKDHVLLDQVFVRTDKYDGTIGDMVRDLAVRMGENISVSSMARVAIGE
ncbi:MAG: translation elongation factor Ts [Acidimicrobiia bacterium]